MSHKNILSLSWVILFFIITSCNSSQSSIKKEFDSISNSLPKVFSLNDSVNFLYDSIFHSGKQKNNSSVADSIFASTQKALAYISYLKNYLTAHDPSGEDTKLSTQFMLDEKRADTLTMVLWGVYNSCEQASPNSDYNKLDSLTEEMKMKLSEKGWKNGLFNNTSTVGTITILSKYEDVCRHEALIAFNEILSH